MSRALVCRIDRLLQLLIVGAVALLSSAAQVAGAASLQELIDAAPDGAVIVVEEDEITYDPVRIIDRTLEIRGIEGEDLVLVPRFEIENSFIRLSLLRNNHFFDRCSPGGTCTQGVIALRSFLVIQDCQIASLSSERSFVEIYNSSTADIKALDSSVLLLADSAVIGTESVVRCGIAVSGCGFGPFSNSTPGIKAIDSIVEVARSTIRGGNAGVPGYTLCPYIPICVECRPASPGLLLENSLVNLCVESTTVQNGINGDSSYCDRVPIPPPIVSINSQITNEICSGSVGIVLY